VRDMSPWMEVVAVLLPLAGLAGLAVAGLTLVVDRFPLMRTFALSLVVLSAVSTALPRLPTAGDGDTAELTVVAANLTGDNRHAGQAVTRLMVESPDILVLEEANPHSRRRYADIMLALPYAAGSDDDLTAAQTVLFSKYPVSPVVIPPSVDTGRIVAVVVDAPTPFLLVGAHLPRPWFQSNEVERMPDVRHDLIRSLADWLATFELPVILAGDLNSTDRGLDYRTLLRSGDLVDSMRSAWASTTSTKWWPLLLRIDHVLVRGFCPVSASNTGLPGSDHQSVVVELQFCG
jgi:endonuclease/exonuclease/phosphatase (EEP) superfamily protein YafD